MSADLDATLARIDREYDIRARVSPVHVCLTRYGEMTVQGHDICAEPVVAFRIGAASVHMTPAEARVLGAALLASADESCAVVAALAEAA